MSADRTTSPFFVAGGTLRPGVPSYVTRPSDDELFTQAIAGEFCYVLTPRQMGKSSLMVRTAQRLKAHNREAVIIDLTEIGTVSIDKWYQGLITELQRSLRLPVDVGQWWADQDHLGQPQRFHHFLQDVVLQKIDGQVVIFIDEIDSMLKLDFRDDFFAVIRALYNGRAQNSELTRLSFVLLGVASPPDLIKDRTRTPFNIGHEINLGEINRTDATALIEGLNEVFPGQGEIIFDRIYYWTSGHPYLTQKLCAAVVKRPEEEWIDPQIDQLVYRTFLTDEARGETNIQFVNDLVTNHPQKGEMIKIYRRIYKNQKVKEEKTSPEQAHLKLSGLVKIEKDHLVVRNQIYRHAFDLKWVKEHTAVNWQLAVTAISVAIAFIAVSILGFNFYQNQKADNAELDFRQGESPQARAEALAALLGMRPLPFTNVSYDLRAYDLFFELDSWDEQADIYESAGQDQLILIIQRMYVTMALVDENNDSSSLALEKMLDELDKFSGNQEASKLILEIEYWLSARDAMRGGTIAAANEALAAYNEAILINDKNPATSFERARVLAFLGRYEEAAIDLDTVIALAVQSSILEAASTPDTGGSIVENVLTGSSTSEAAAPATRIPALVPTEAMIITTPAAINPDDVEVQNNETFPVPTSSASTSTIPVEPSISPGTVPKPPSRSEFITRGQIRGAVNRLINEYPALANHLRNSAPALYQNLANFALIPPTTDLVAIAVFTATAASAEQAQTATAVANINFGLQDNDNDGLSNAKEAEFGTNPNKADTDEDGLKDGEEINSDGVRLINTDPLAPDTDNDGLLDGEEVQGNPNPPPQCEPARGQYTNPAQADSDGDGSNDCIDPDSISFPTPTPTLVAIQVTPDPGPELIEIGRSVNDVPLEAIRFGYGPHVVLFIGGLHAGFAPATVQIAEKTIEYFTENLTAVPANATVYVIRNANPDTPHSPGNLAGRLNANGVDLNRNWDCRWVEDAPFRGQVISGIGGHQPFSEPETQALKGFIEEIIPSAIVIWEARYPEGFVSPGRCARQSSVSFSLAEQYGRAAGYQVDDFEIDTSQILNGDAANWLDSQGYPIVAVLLPEYVQVDWESSLLGILAVVGDRPRPDS